MSKPHIVFDIETVADYQMIARVNRMPEENELAARALLGDEFPKPIYHRIVCISALGAVYTDEKTWRVHEWASLHTGERSEAEIIGEFLKMVDKTMPVLVSYNGLGFDLPVVQARSLLNRLTCFHLPRYRYFSQYSDLHVDLCVELGMRGQQRLKLDEACVALGVPGKLDGVDGGNIENLVATARLADVAHYCAGDVAATYRLFLLRELFCGRLTLETLETSMQQADDMLRWVLTERPDTFVQQ